jgi:hypothetical protein
MPAVTLAIACTGPANQAFTGNGFLIPGGTSGASAKIEFLNTSLCVGSSQSFTANWVGIQPNPAGTNKIAQLGWIHCDATGPTCVQDNSPFYFYAYGWDAGECALRIPTAIKAPKGNASSGMPTYTVQVITGSVDFRISGVNQYTGLSQSTLERCWEDVAEGAAWTNETLNFGDQVGGPTSNHLNFESVQYHTSTWLTPGTPAACNLTDLPHGDCDWAPSPPGKFWVWDTRY